MSIRTNFQILLNKIEAEKRAVLNELDFKDKEDFKEYTDDHNVRDTTKVTIDGKEMKAGEVSKETKPVSAKMEKTFTRIEDSIKDIKDPVQKENATTVLRPPSKISLINSIKKVIKEVKFLVICRTSGRVLNS